MSWKARWKAVRTGDGDIHVVPIADLRRHRYDRKCWCEPTLEMEIEEDGEELAVKVSHFAADGRDLVERYGLM